MAENYYKPCKELDDCLEIDKYWYKQAALQGHDLAIEKCKEYNIEI